MAIFIFQEVFTGRQRRHSKKCDSVEEEEEEEEEDHLLDDDNTTMTIWRKGLKSGEEEEEDIFTRRITSIYGHDTGSLKRSMPIVHWLSQLQMLSWSFFGTPCWDQERGGQKYI